MADLSKYPSQWLALSAIDFSDKTFQYRKEITPGSLAGLCASLKEEGQKFPVVVWDGGGKAVITREQSPGNPQGNTLDTPVKPGYDNQGKLQLISGFRRVSAAKELGWEKILAVVIPQADMTADEALRLNFIENIERKTLTNLDIMFACKKMSNDGLSNVEIGKLIGKDEKQVRRYIAITETSSETQDRLAKGEITIDTAAKGSLGLESEALVDNHNSYVKSSKKTFEAKLKIPINTENTSLLEAHIIALKKGWKEALKQAKGKKSKRDSQAKAFADFMEKAGKMQEALHNPTGPAFASATDDHQADGKKNIDVITRAPLPGNPRQSNAMDTPDRPGHDNKTNTPPKHWQPAADANPLDIPQEAMEGLPPEMREAYEQMKKTLGSLPPELLKKMNTE